MTLEHAILSVLAMSKGQIPTPALDRAESVLSSSEFKQLLHPLVAEFFGWHFMRALGIGAAPEIELITADEAKQRDSTDWILKTRCGLRLKAYQGGPLADPVLAVAKIPGAITLSALFQKFGILQQRIAIESRPHLDGYLDLMQKGKQDWSGGHFFHDFVLPDDRSLLERAIALDSEGMLRIHAARIFLGCSAAHASNVLVNSQGTLFSVDHEYVPCNPGDIEWAFYCLGQNTSARRALERVCALTESQVEECLNDLPEELWRLTDPKRVEAAARGLLARNFMSDSVVRTVLDAVSKNRLLLDDKEKATEYFLGRLRKWKELCG